MYFRRLRVCFLLLPLLLSACISTAVGLTAGTVKVATAVVTLPVKATVKVAGAMLDDDEDCDEAERRSRGRDGR